MNLIFLMGVFFLVSMQPVFMMGVLIVMTFLYSLKIYEYLSSYWFSYILLMVMLSGVLVVFTYMASLTPNESFEIYSIVIFLFLMFSLLVGWYCDYSSDVSMLSVGLWSSYLGVFSLFLVSFLLGVMLMVVILSYMNDGSVREI